MSFSVSCLVAAIIFTSIQVLPAHSQRSGFNPLNGLFTPNSSQQFFEAGEQRLEQETKLLQIQRIPTDQLLELEEEDLTFQKVPAWCIDSQGNIVITDSEESQVTPQKPMVSPPCH